MKITCIQILDLALLNTISFLFNHNAQQSAATPSKIWFLSLRFNPNSQEPNKFATLVGDGISKNDMHNIPNKARKVIVKEQVL